MSKATHNDIRITITLKNNILVSKREELQLTQMNMAKFCEVDMNIYAAFENLKAHPNDSDRIYENALKLCETLEMELHEVFPEGLTKIKVNKKMIRCSSEHLKALSYEPKQMLQIEHNDLKEKIDGLLKTLSPRESQVLQDSFGLINDDEQTLDEVGEILGVQGGRVRQIEAKALRKLRHPSRSNSLKPFVDPDFLRTSKMSETLYSELIEIRANIDKLNTDIKVMQNIINAKITKFNASRKALFNKSGVVSSAELAESNNLYKEIEKTTALDLKPLINQMSDLRKLYDDKEEALIKEKERMSQC